MCEMSADMILQGGLVSLDVYLPTSARLSLLWRSGILAFDPQPLHAWAQVVLSVHRHSNLHVFALRLCARAYVVVGLHFISMKIILEGSYSYEHV